VRKYSEGIKNSVLGKRKGLKKSEVSKSGHFQRPKKREEPKKRKKGHEKKVPFVFQGMAKGGSKGPSKRRTASKRGQEKSKKEKGRPRQRGGMMDEQELGYQ